MGIEFTTSQLVTLITSLIGIAFSYGILSQKINNLNERIHEIDDLRNEVKKISDSLHELIGKIDTWINITTIKRGE